MYKSTLDIYVLFLFGRKCTLLHYLHFVSYKLYLLMLLEIWSHAVSSNYQTKFGQIIEYVLVNTPHLSMDILIYTL